MNPRDEKDGYFACADGRIRHGAVRNLDEMIRNAAFHETPPDLAQRVKTKLEKAGARRAPLVGPTWSRAALAACVAAVAIGVGNLMGASVSDILQQRIHASGIELWESDSGEGFTDFFSENGAEEKTQ